MKDRKPFNIHSRIKSFSFALQGIVTFFKTQHNAWIHLLAGIVAAGMGFYFQLDTTRWCMIVIAIALVFIAEVLNTAIEFLSDMVSPDFHPMIKKAKDASAAAVLIAALAAIIIGAIVFVPEFL